MRIVGRDLPIEREVWSRAQAKEVFGEIGENYKVQIINDLISEDEEISIYRQGEWLDVCRGPHLPSTAAAQGVQARAAVSGAATQIMKCCSALRHCVARQKGA